MSQHTELVERLRTYANGGVYTAPGYCTKLMLEAADTIEALSVNPLREALETVADELDDEADNLCPNGDTHPAPFLREQAAIIRKALGEQQP